MTLNMLFNFCAFAFKLHYNKAVDGNKKYYKEREYVDLDYYL